MKQIKTCLVIFAGLFALASMSCVSTNRYEKTTESTYQDGKLIGQAITLRKDGKIVSKTSSEMRSADISGIHADVLIESSEKESYDKTNIKLYKNGAFIGEKNFKTKNGRISSEITDSATKTSSKDDKYKELIDYHRGKLKFDEALEISISRTKAFCRRQQTWFKKFEPALWFDMSESSHEDEIIKTINNHIHKNKEDLS